MDCKTAQLFLEFARPHAEEYLDAVRYRAAANRAMALGAGALGSTRLRRW